MTNASHISRTLRSHGFNPLGSGTPVTREGVRVKQSGSRVVVVCDFDSSSTARRRADQVVEALTDSGIPNERLSSNIVWVEDAR